MTARYWRITAACLALLIVPLGAGLEAMVTSVDAAPAAVKSYKPGGQSKEWLIWRPITASYAIARQHPAEWQAVIRPTPKKYTIAFTAQEQTFAFNILINKGMREAAAQAGVELLFLDNQFPDTSRPLEVADLVVVRKPDLVISFNALQALYPAILEKYKRARLPVITVTFKNEGIPVYGANNFDVGVIAGKYLAKYATQQGWPTDQLFVVGCDDLRLGQFVRARISGTFFALNQALPGIPARNYFTLDCPADPERSRVLMTDWLTAHPGATYILMTVISDSRLLGMASALKAAGREQFAAGIGQAADPSALEAIRRGDSAFVASVAYFPEQYGIFLIGLALDILEGKPVPAESFVPAVAIDRTNINRFYPVR